MSTEKEDGLCENKLCNDLDIKCSISSNSTQGIDSISINNNVDVSVCANCGKGEEESHKLKSCTACKLVKYCSRDCQIAHRPQHKKECRKRAAELHDEKLFKQPPPKDDCPICFVQLPSLATGCRYKTCCGKTICSGCAYAPVYDDRGNEVAEEKQNECAFCRVVAPKSNKVSMQRLTKRMELDDPIAIFNLGYYYREGKRGFPQDYGKALELWHRAAELGEAEAYTAIGNAYEFGRGVEIDMKTGNYYYELAAMKGETSARYNLGLNEFRVGNWERVLKHYMIAVRGGHSKSLDQIKVLYSNGHATKEDYTKALQSYQAYLAEIKSDQRDKAAAAGDGNRYY